MDVVRTQRKLARRGHGRGPNGEEATTTTTTTTNGGNDLDDNEKTLLLAGNTNSNSAKTATAATTGRRTQARAGGRTQQQRTRFAGQQQQHHQQQQQQQCLKNDDEDATTVATASAVLQHAPQRPLAPTTTTTTTRNPFSRLRQAAAQHRQLRRAKSAPPNLFRQQGQHHHHHGRTRLIEEHYRVDPEKRVVLPGVPKHDPDWARDSHDFFNLVVLVPVVALNVMNWNTDLLLQWFFSNNYNYNTSSSNNNNNSKTTTAATTTIANAWTGEYFDLFFIVTTLYFIIDLLWIVIIPTCVKSPATILQHHCATLLYLFIPYRHVQYRWCMGACMIVEINTWFLIARRVFNKQGFPPWIIDLSFVSIRIKLISIFFYITWISIRCVLYPYLLPLFYQNWVQHSLAVGTPWNLVMICVPLHFVFCLLNLKWTYDLLLSKLRYWTKCYHHYRSKSTTGTTKKQKDAATAALYNDYDKGL